MLAIFQGRKKVEFHKSVESPGARDGITYMLENQSLPASIFIIVSRPTVLLFSFGVEQLSPLSLDSGGLSVLVYDHTNLLLYGAALVDIITDRSLCSVESGHGGVRKACVCCSSAPVSFAVGFAAATASSHACLAFCTKAALAPDYLGDW